MKLDTQQVELIGTAALEAELIRQGFEVARPNRDRGIDLIVYSDKKDKPFSAVPIQVKAATDRSFGAFRKYEKFTGLILAFVWHATTQPRYFLLTHPETVKFIKDPKGYSWQSNGTYKWSGKIPKWVEEGLLPYENRWDILHYILSNPISPPKFE